jgi:glucans biosynthesis protein
MTERRVFLKLAASGLAAGLAPSIVRPARAQTGAPSADSGPFDPSMVVNLARDFAKKPYRPAPTDLPDPFSSLTYDQYVSIGSKPGAAIWAADNVGFAIEPLHRGHIFSSLMYIFLVENGAARRVIYDKQAFDFRKIQVPADLPDLGFSGFRVLQPQDPNGLNEVAIFQGASFFRALARGQTLGVTARALSIRTADPGKGEEFPFIKVVWIEKPSLASNVLIIHALLDSESVTGAYRFTLRPGEATIIDTECTLFTRAAIDHYGLGAMQGAFLFGPIDRHRSEDVRPGVYEINGLQMWNGKDEWLWRPVANRDTLQISAFVDESPRGFGLLQRERSFDDLQDDDQQFEKRPSLWIEPIGEWGPGAVQLVEIPSESEINQNILAYWRPTEGLAANVEASFAYRQFWCWSSPERPSVATTRASRGGRSGKRRRFDVDFTGDVFADPAKTSDIRPNLRANPGTIVSIRTFLSRERRNFRVSFDIDTGSDGYSELRLVLEGGGKPLSETWLYRWTP